MNIWRNNWHLRNWRSRRTWLIGLLFDSNDFFSDCIYFFYIFFLLLFSFSLWISFSFFCLDFIPLFLFGLLFPLSIWTFFHLIFFFSLFFLLYSFFSFYIPIYILFYSIAVNHFGFLPNFFSAVYFFRNINISCLFNFFKKRRRFSWGVWQWHYSWICGRLNK